MSIPGWKTTRQEVKVYAMSHTRCEVDPRPMGEAQKQREKIKSGGSPPSETSIAAGDHTRNHSQEHAAREDDDESTTIPESDGEGTRIWHVYVMEEQ
jgi:hypothetical protein